MATKDPKTKRSAAGTRSAGSKSAPKRKSSSGGSRSAASTRSKSAAKGKGKSTSKGKSKSKAKQAVPMRREITALILFLLAIFAAFGYFHIDAIFITFFCNLLKGLFGYGFYFAPPALLVASVILMFHRGKPVGRRVVCTLLLPLFLGALAHLLFCHGMYGFGIKDMPALWSDGLAMRCGGAVSGWIAVALTRVFSRIGAAVLVLLSLFFCNMIITKITPVDIWDGICRAFYAVRDFMENRPAYEEREEEPKSRRRAEEAAQAPRKGGARDYDIPAPRKKVRSAIDIALDDEPVPQKPDQPEPFFDSTPGVRPPHEFLEQEVATQVEQEKTVDPGVPEVKLEVESFCPVEPEIPAVEEEKVSERPEVNAAPVVSSSPVKPEPVAQSVAPVVPPVVVPVRPAVAAQPPMPPKDTAPAAVRAAQPIQKTTSSVGEPGVYQYPPVDLLERAAGVSNAAATEEMNNTREMLDGTLQSFGIDARIINVTRGPSVTRYELELMRGVKLHKLTNLSSDIALSLGAQGVRIAPIPGRNSVVGIEVPNQLVAPVPIREVIDSKEFRTHTSKVAFAVGKDISGKNVVGNIAKLPHMLIAGTTGSGKSVCTNSLIVSLLYKSSPEDVRLIMVDPKVVELSCYNGIPHLLIPVVTDPKKAAGALQWAVTEMMKRYRLFSDVGAKDLNSYNAHMREQGEEKMPHIVIIIDELADLMLVAKKEVEESICRVAQMGRAAGMHLIIATQRPSADVITGLMKANIPSRIAFAVASSMESRIILDSNGAEQLVGKGDMFYAPLGIGKPMRVQGCMITEEEVAHVVEFIKQTSNANYDDSVMQEVESNAESTGKKGRQDTSGSASSTSGPADDADELLPAAIEVVVDTGMASVSMLQRRLKLGYSRAARLVDQMEERKIVGQFEGSKPRQVLISKEDWLRMKIENGDAAGGVEASEEEYAAAMAMSAAADASAEDVPDYLETDDEGEGEAPF